MEARRRQFAAEIKADLSRTETVQMRDKETLKNILNLKLPAALTVAKKQELHSNISTRENTIVELQQREKDFLTGKLDDFITFQITQQQTEYKAKNVATIKKKTDTANEEKKSKEKCYAKERIDNDVKQSKRDHNYFYKQFCRIGESIPSYMYENLQTMPNNKGYIWRNCWFLGHLEAEYGQPTVIFEKMRGGIMRIHEYDQYEYRLYEKLGKERKKLIFSRPKKAKKCFKGFAPGTRK